MKSFWFLLFLVFCLAFATAVQPVQKYEKILLNPYYASNLTNNVWRNYTISVNPTDGFSRVVSALVNFKVFMTGQTITFSLLVNGIPCNNPTYVISTTYAIAGQNDISFDCSNVINKTGDYRIDLRASGSNTGSVLAWLDLTYFNNPRGDLTMHGTEYKQGDLGKVWLQLLDSNKQPINNGLCFATIYYPDGRVFEDKATMIFLANGVYYLDFIAPYLIGVYPAIADCYYSFGANTYVAYNGVIQTGTLKAGSYVNTRVLDGSVWGIDSATNAIRLQMNFSGLTAPVNFSNIVWTTYASWAGTTNIYLWVYNWSSGGWIMLPNPITPSAAIIGFTNSMSLTNLTSSGLVNSSGYMILNLNTSGVANAKRLSLDYVSVALYGLLNGSWQEVRGSSEIHISPSGNEQFVSEITSCGMDSESLSCGVFEDDVYFNYREGILTDNVTIMPLTIVPMETFFIYETPFAQDCSAVYYVLKFNSSSGKYDIDLTDDVIFQAGNKQNCRMKIPIELNGSLNPQYYRIIQDNYMKWESDWLESVFDSVNETIFFTCSLVNELYGGGSYNYVVPLNNSIQLSEVPALRFCHRTIDDLWWLRYFLDVANETTSAGDFEGLLYELRFYRELLFRDYSFFNNLYNIQNYFDNQYLTSVLNYLKANISRDVWNYENRNLTYYNQSVGEELRNCLREGSCSEWWVNYSLISLNASLKDLRYCLETGDCSWFILNRFSQIPFEVWAFNNRNLTFVDWSSGAYYFWNYENRNLTYYNLSVFDYDYLSGLVWNHSSRELTYYNQSVSQLLFNCLRKGECVDWWINFSFLDLNNSLTSLKSSVFDLSNCLKDGNCVSWWLNQSFSNIPRDVWNYVERNLTFVDWQTGALYVWNYENKNLTFYEDVLKYDYLTGLVWNNSNRELTFYNQSFSELLFNCLQKGNCVGWWINLTLIDLNNTGFDLSNCLKNGVCSSWWIEREFSKLPQEVWAFSNRNLTFIDWQTGVMYVWNASSRNLTYYGNGFDYALASGYVWNYSERNLTYYNQSVSELQINCLRDGNCLNWWINASFQPNSIEIQSQIPVVFYKEHNLITEFVFKTSQGFLDSLDYLSIQLIDGNNSIYASQVFSGISLSNGSYRMVMPIGSLASTGIYSIRVFAKKNGLVGSAVFNNRLVVGAVFLFKIDALDKECNSVYAKARITLINEGEVSNFDGRLHTWISSQSNCGDMVGASYSVQSVRPLPLGEKLEIEVSKDVQTLAVKEFYYFCGRWEFDSEQPDVRASDTFYRDVCPKTQELSITGLVVGIPKKIGVSPALFYTFCFVLLIFILLFIYLYRERFLRREHVV